MNEYYESLANLALELTELDDWERNFLLFMLTNPVPMPIQLDKVESIFVRRFLGILDEQ